MQSTQSNIKCDLAIVGGGLSGGLIALAMAKLRPEIKIVLIDQEQHFGGNHIWSFFASDIAPEHRWLTAPLVTYGWSGHEAYFSDSHHHLDEIYYSIESERLDWLLRHSLPPQALLTGRVVKAVSPRLVVLEGGQRINASGVIDARGVADTRHLQCVWKKSVGQLLQLSDPHNVTKPIIMDARIGQAGSYGYMTLLPFGMDKLFIQNICYSERPEFLPERHIAVIAQYAQVNGWKIDRVLREEQGIFPVTMGGNFDDYWASGSGRVAKAGARGGYFHPATCNSLPDAIRFAIFFAGQNDFDGDRLHMHIKHHADAHWAKAEFYRRINHMLFKEKSPAERHIFWERFISLDPDLIARFHAGESTAKDKAILLSGNTPSTFGRAWSLLRNTNRK